MYAKYMKRLSDIIFSIAAIVVLSPLFLILCIVGFIIMGGNPFFVQERPGWHEKIFKLIKFRTMDNRRDRDGNLLPDAVRLNPYGRFLRSTSLDELPELFNILKGDMSIIGPRPLVVRYLPYYTEQERHRHDVRPGLTGLAQINGRNALEWEKRFSYDLTYVSNITAKNDIKILLKTVQKVFGREAVVVCGEGSIQDLDVERMEKKE